MDISPLVKILATTTHGRIIDFAQVRTEGPLQVANIPIAGRNPGDPGDKALTKFVRDWFRTEHPDHKVDVAIHRATGMAYTADDGEQTPLVAILVISYWPKEPAGPGHVKPTEKMGETGRARTWGSRSEAKAWSG